MAVCSPPGREMDLLPPEIQASVCEAAATRGLSPQATATTNPRKVSETDLGTAYAIEMSDGETRLNLFIKCLHGADETFVSEREIYFGNEVLFYGEILRYFLEIERRNSADINIPFTSAPKCMSVGGGGVPFIILEDLLSKGYRVMDVRVPMTVELARLVLQQLGRFHAFSFAAKDQCPDAFDSATSKLQETVFSEELKPTYGKLFRHAIHDALKLAKQSFPKDSIYVEKLAVFTLDIYDRMSLLAVRDTDSRVITHGDLWLNNILCKFDRDTGYPEDATFVDFQSCRYASPVHDLMFVLLLGLDKSTRDEFRDDFLHCYHASVCEKLEEFGLDAARLFPFSELSRQLRKHSRFAMAMGLVGLPMYLNEGAFAPQNRDNASAGGDVGQLIQYVQNVNSNKTMKCKNKMLEIIMDCVDQGYLD